MSSLCLQFALKIYITEKEKSMIVTIGGIPVYNATIPDDDCGMLKISLVDDPAVMSNFQAFDKEKKMMMYAITDEEKRLVHGVVMRADFPIYRYDKKLGEYYIIYKADTIRQMAEKYLVENRQNNVNLMHEENSDVTGVDMVQYYIKDSAKGINPEGFDEIADGSLFAEFHVTNDDVWNAIKDGTYKGFSLEGVFGMEAEQDKESVEQIVDSLDGKFSRLFNKLSNKFNMTKLSRFKAALLKAFAEFANVTTDKGILVWDGDEDLKEGDAVFIEDADGNRTPAEDGDYTTDDNKVIVVVDGKVSEIKDAEAEVAPEADPTDETEQTNVDETPAETTPEETPAETPVDEIEELKKKIEELTAENDALKAENESLKAEIETLKGEKEELQKMSAAKPAHDEVKDEQKFSKTGLKGVDKIAHYMSL